jgi:hypothetical protein
MLRATYTFVLFFLLVPTVTQSAAQMPQPITNAPFIAMRIQTSTQPSGSQTTFGTLARSSDGSGYVEFHSSDGAGIALIQDVVHHRMIELYLKKHMYSVFPQPNIKASTWPREGYTQYYIKSVGKPGSKQELDGGWEITTIGQRVIEGVVTVGLIDQSTDGQTSEHWYSPALDLDLNRKSHVPAKSFESDTQIQQLHLEEPDAKLFEIPEGYVLYKYKGKADKACSETAASSHGC